MFNKLNLIIVALFITVVSTYADDLIVEPEDGTAPLVKLIDNAIFSIDLSIYQLWGYNGNQPAITDALVRAKERGVDVRIIVNHFTSDSWPRSGIKDLMNEIIWASNNGLYMMPSSYGATGFTYTHNKYMVIDAHHGSPLPKAIIMTGNLDVGSFPPYKVRNFYIVDNNSIDVNYLEDLFQMDITNATKYPVTKVTPVPIPNDLMITPYKDDKYDNVTKIKEFTQSARNTLDIYIMYFGVTNCPQGIFDGIKDAINNGVKVRILISNCVDSQKEIELFHREFGDPFPPNFQFIIEPKDADIFIHTKTFIKDDDSVLLGSINMSNTSFYHNREVNLITSYPEIVSRIQKTFNADWDHFSAGGK